MSVSEPELVSLSSSLSDRPRAQTTTADDVISDTDTSRCMCVHVCLFSAQIKFIPVLSTVSCLLLLGMWKIVCGEGRQGITSPSRVRLTHVRLHPSLQTCTLPLPPLKFPRKGPA